jgi:hypothetical protein
MGKVEGIEDNTMPAEADEAIDDADVPLEAVVTDTLHQPVESEVTGLAAENSEEDVWAYDDDGNLFRDKEYVGRI